ncbi:MAG: hypothetical protein VYB09_06420 [Planctomycetota bacterium]|nr:hypothetical protein [Planctomycetota bacterium]
MKYMNLFAAMIVAALMVVVGCGESKAPVPPGGPDMMDNQPDPEMEGSLGEDPGEEGEEEGGDDAAAEGGDDAAAEGGDDAAAEGGDEG